MASQATPTPAPHPKRWAGNIRPGVNPATTEQLLRSLATLHRVTGQCPGPESFERARRDAAELLASWGVRA